MKAAVDICLRIVGMFLLAICLQTILMFVWVYLLDITKGWDSFGLHSKLGKIIMLAINCLIMVFVLPLIPSRRKK